MTDRLLRMAEHLGVRVQWHHGGPKGWYSHQHRTISLRHGMGAVHTRCTLAHEIAHAMRGDEKTGCPRLDQRIESRAERDAALLLIDPAAYAEVEARIGPHTPGLAQALRVTHEIIETYQRITS